VEDGKTDVRKLPRKRKGGGFIKGSIATQERLPQRPGVAVSTRDSNQYPLVLYSLQVDLVLSYTMLIVILT